MKWEYKAERRKSLQLIIFFAISTEGGNGRNGCGEHRDRRVEGTGGQEGTTGRAGLGKLASYANTR